MLNGDKSGEFNKLQELLMDFMPVISRIGRNLDKIYKDIEGEHEGFFVVDSLLGRENCQGQIESHIIFTPETKRVTILQWFSTVPYQKHHNLACEGRVEHTGSWLFQRKEFISWENSNTSTILWLHGIRKSAKPTLFKI